jgi:hypothetical protein
MFHCSADWTPANVMPDGLVLVGAVLVGADGGTYTGSANAGAALGAMPGRPTLAGPELDPGTTAIVPAGGSVAMPVKFGADDTDVGGTYAGMAGGVAAGAVEPYIGPPSPNSAPAAPAELEYGLLGALGVGAAGAGLVGVGEGSDGRAPNPPPPGAMPVAMPPELGVEPLSNHPLIGCAPPRSTGCTLPFGLLPVGPLAVFQFDSDGLTIAVVGDGFTPDPVLIVVGVEPRPFLVSPFGFFGGIRRP